MARSAALAADVKPLDRFLLRLSARTREWAIVGAFFIGAMLIRLPYLWDIPRLTDELQEILWALAIARGEILPLTAVDSYYGPVWSYLLAGVFKVFGISDAAPRLTATVLASVTVCLTYLIGRELAGRWAGIIAALLMVTSGGHVIITSHTARSNSTTPLLLLLVAWTVLRAVRRNDGRFLVAAGFLFALALQTHISVIAFAPGLALVVLLQRPGLIRSRWLVLAFGAVAIGYGNMIAWNLQNDFYSLLHARHLQEGYTDGRRMDLASYFTNLQALIQSLSRLLSGTIDIANSPSRFLYSAAAALGLALLAWRREVLPLLFCLSAIIVLPYFNPRYGPILSGRYLIPLLPFCYLGIATLIQTLGHRLTGRSAAGLLLAAVAVSFPLVHLVWYYDEVLADDRTNAPLYSLANSARALHKPGDLVLLDEGLEQEPLTGGGNDLKALRMLLETRGLTYEVAKIERETLAPVIENQKEALVIMDLKKRQTVDRQVRISTTGAVEESASGSGHRYGVYRLVARETRSAETAQ